MSQRTHCGQTASIVHVCSRFGVVRYSSLSTKQPRPTKASGASCPTINQFSWAKRSFQTLRLVGPIPASLQSGPIQKGCRWSIDILQAHQLGHKQTKHKTNMQNTAQQQDVSALIAEGTYPAIVRGFSFPKPNQVKADGTPASPALTAVLDVADGDKTYKLYWKGYLACKSEKVNALSRKTLTSVLGYEKEKHATFCTEIIGKEVSVAVRHEEDVKTKLPKAEVKFINAPRIQVDADELELMLGVSEPEMEGDL